MNKVFAGLSETEQNELLTGILDNSYHGIVALDAVRDVDGTIRDFRYIFCNQMAESGLGRSISEVVGKTLLGLFPGVAEEGIFDRFVKVAETGEPYSFDRPYYRDGLAGFYQSSASKFKDGLLISFLETTKLVSESENWKRLIERYEMATQTAGVGVWELDVTTNVLAWDRSMFEIYQTKLEDFQGIFEDWTEKVHPEDLEPVKASLEQSISDHKDVAVKFRIIPSKGMIRWIDARAKVILNEHGKTSRIIGTNWDITELQNAYERLAEAKMKAEGANAAKSEFLAVMSHELRTPLNPIIGGTDLLRESISNDHDVAILDMIQSCGNSLLNLISDILEFCTAEAGHLSLEPVPTDIVRVTREVIAESQVAAKKKGIALRFKPEASLPAVCQIDPKRYKQIIRNLISNAVKFTEKGLVDIQLSGADSGKTDGYIVVKVRDSGEGIPEEKQDFIFERFTQLDSSNTRKEGGTGLGLAICRKLCQLMRGEISVKSELGVGSTFTVRLPYAASPSLEDEPPSAPEHGLMDGDSHLNTRALLIDDDASNLAYLSAVLRREGIRVLTEQDPHKGQELVKAGDYDIAFLDIHMPGISGFDLVNNLREHIDPSKCPPLVAITADLRDENASACQKLGFDRILYKPARPSEIRQILKELL